MRSYNLCKGGRALRIFVEISLLALLLGTVVGTAMSITSTSTSNSFVDSWVIVFTYRETPLPDEAVNFLCSEVKPTLVSWIEQEAGKYQQTKPFSDITCFQEQILLPNNLLVGYPRYAEGQWITNPLNDSAVIEFIQNKNPALTNTKYVTVIHYIPYEIQFVNYMYSNKYDFIFIKSPFSNSFYPDLTIDNYGETLIHEFMHKLGALDKYDGVQQACLTNPETGQQYSGYDIMCHRVKIDDSGFIFPPFSELVVTEPTANEINWILPGVESIETSPSSATVNIGDTKQFIAIAEDQTGNPMAGINISWTVSNSTVGSVSPLYAITGLNGKAYATFMAAAAGTTMVNATNGSVRESAIVTVAKEPLQNLILNPGFESGKTSWIFYTNGTGTFTAEDSGYVGLKFAKIAIINPGTNTQLYQMGITVKPNTHYRLRFAAKSTGGNDLTVELLKHVSPFTNYGLNKNFDLTSSWQEFSTEFNTSGFTNTANDGRLKFWLASFAKAGDIYYIDNVSLETVPVIQNLILNPGFESGKTSWIFYTNGTGTFTAEDSGYVGLKFAKITIINPGTNIQLYQMGITVKPNTHYRLRFAAKSTSGNDLTVELLKHVSPFTNYGLNKNFDLTSSWQEFSTEFNTSGFKNTVNNGRLKFWLASFAKAGDIYSIDNVSLEII